MNKIFLVILLGIFSFFPAKVWAGGAVAATQQRKQAVAAQRQMIMQQMLMQRPVQAETDVIIPGPPEKVEDIVDITDLWKRFETDSRVWELIMDQEAKVATVTHFSQMLARQGIKIHKSPDQYAAMIDSLSAQTPDLLDNSFDRVLSLVAILEYDYDNGENPDVVAQRFLGPERYQENRKRLGHPVR